MKNKFLPYLIFIALALGVSFGIAKMEKGNEQPFQINAMENTKTLRHVVLFKFKEGTTEKDLKAVEMAFAGLPAKIPEIVDFEWGTNNSPEGLEKGFTHCFFLTFKSEADRDTYLPHPDHKAFGEIVKPHLEDVLVVDYWVN